MKIVIGIKPNDKSSNHSELLAIITLITSLYLWLKLYCQERDVRLSGNYTHNGMEYASPQKIGSWRNDMSSQWTRDIKTIADNIVSVEYWEKARVELKFIVKEYPKNIEIECTSSNAFLLVYIHTLLIKSLRDLTPEEIEEVFIKARNNELMDSWREWKFFMNGKEVKEINAEKVFLKKLIRGLPVFAYEITEFSLKCLSDHIENFVADDLQQLMKYKKTFIAIESF
jgi:hypothetical protein